MEIPKTTSDLQLGMLIAKAEATLAGVNRVSDDLRELTGRIREIETGLSTRITALALLWQNESGGDSLSI